MNWRTLLSNGRRLPLLLGGVALVGFLLGWLGAYLQAQPVVNRLEAAVDESDGRADAAQEDLNAQTAELEELQGQKREFDSVRRREASIAGTEAELARRAQELDQREAALTGQEEAQAAARIGDGTWTVGIDVAAGTYRTTAEVGSNCYWAILVSGTNGDDIVQNDLPGGGRPTVTIGEGQDFVSQRCGTWDPVG